MANIILLKDVGEAMNKAAIEAFPNECCGFFFGHEISGDRVVQEVMPVENSKEGDQRRRFSIDPKAYMDAEKRALAMDMNLLGVYHSHPSHPAIPSEHDLKQAMPWFSYIILSVEKEEVKKTTSWQLNDARKFENETLKQL